MIEIIDNYITVDELLAPILAKGHKREMLSRLVKDVLNAPQALVNIDVNDIRDLFQKKCGTIYAYEISVDATKESRMEQMMEEIKKVVKTLKSNNHFLFYFFYPENSPLMMHELNMFIKWVEGISGEFHVKWGMAYHPSQTLRTIIILQEKEYLSTKDC